MNDKSTNTAVLTALAGMIAVLAGEIAAKGGMDTNRAIDRLKQLQDDIERIHGSAEKVVELAFEMVREEIKQKGNVHE